MPIQIKKIGWDIPDTIGSCHTTRIGGCSKGTYGHANLSYDVGDTRTTVKKNRSELKKTLGLDQEPAWMKQIHSSYVRKVTCLLYTSPSPRDRQKSRMPSSA